MSFSMTGYGQSAVQYGGYKIQIEVKSVNHRYCEVMLRLPREWAGLEDTLRKLVQSRLKRGRIDVFVNKEQDGGEQAALKLDQAAVRSYIQAARELQQFGELEGRLDINQLLSLPGVMTVQENGNDDDPEQWRELLEQGLGEALTGLLEMRVREGRHLAEDLRGRLDHLQQIYAEMRRLAPTVVEEHRVRLRQRLSELQDGSFHWDESRVGMEIAIFADRSNIDEELTRLASHFEQFRNLLHTDEPIGRKMDFLLQEMNREVNTIGSKANHLALVNHVVEMKAELEKIREQAANLE
ncbi:YicC/YloC family endoribonuclease [Paenibacillus bovis]|uniref:YicC family protein n=1 Tax=Paenibacillus bovis TaxID=1616788 RepID=A0A172ZJ00_9BACL|nr:YicC/YloC family endoribonuclease [Paenibacillus bovis]ANF97615.1 YicC family protein [Paenibacillus bovis]